MDFLCFSPIGWATMDGAHRPVQFARELRRRGHRIFFVELELSADRPRTPDLRVASPHELGLPVTQSARAWYGQDFAELADFRAGLGKALDEFEKAQRGQRIAIWNIPWAPLVEMAPLLRARGYTLVYDCLDNFEGLNESGYYLYFPEVEDYIIRQSDLMLVLSTFLYDKFKDRARNIVLVRDGVQLGDFADVPARVTDGGAPRLGFWGTLNHFMIDVALLEHVGKARPQWQIDLIGPYDTDPLSPPIGPRLKALPNIHLLGPRPHAELAQHLGRFDVCLLPAPVDAFNCGRDPVKIYEYLAGHRPVVATKLPQLTGIPYTYLAENYDDFVAAAEHASTTPVDAAALDKFLSEQTWACRVDLFLERLGQVRPRPEIDPFVRPAPRTDAPALLAYIRQLEQVWAEREAHIGQLEKLLAETGLRRLLRRLWKRVMHRG